jgi:elongation factor G
MDRYLSGEDIDPKVLIEDLEKAVAQGSFFPVLTVSSLQGVGLAELLEVMTQAFPAPAEHPLPGVTTVDGKPVPGLACDPKGPLLAEVVKTASDPYVGRISLVRARPGRARPRRPRHRRADRRAHLAAGQAAAPGGAVRRG